MRLVGGALEDLLRFSNISCRQEKENSSLFLGHVLFSVFTAYHRVCGCCTPSSHTLSLSLTKQLEITSSSLFIRKSLFFLGKLSISSAALSLYVPLKAKNSFNVTEAQNVNKHVFRLFYSDVSCTSITAQTQRCLT